MSSEQKCEGRAPSQLRPVDEFVWPVKVYEYILWHGVPETRAQSFVDGNGFHGLYLAKALLGFSQERRTAEGKPLAIESAPERWEDLLPSDSQWPVIKEFLRSCGVKILSPMARE